MFGIEKSMLANHVGEPAVARRGMSKILERGDPYVDHVLALVPLEGVGAGALAVPTDGHLVHIARRARQFDLFVRFFYAILRVCSCVSVPRKDKETVVTSANQFPAL
jgi:hypothetical protein